MTGCGDARRSRPSASENSGRSSIGALASNPSTPKERIIMTLKSQKHVAKPLQRPPSGPARRPTPGLVEEMERDAAKPPAEGEGAKLVLKRVGELVRSRNALADRVTDAEAVLLKAKADLFRVETVDIPELLHEAGLEEVKLEDGTKVTVREDINCGISEANKPDAFRWLREVGGAAQLIKTSVSVFFPKEKVDKADALFLSLLKKFGDANVTLSETVHAATLKAYLKERREAHAEDPEVTLPPPRIFGVHEYSIAKITAPKDPKRPKASRA